MDQAFRMCLIADLGVSQSVLITYGNDFRDEKYHNQKQEILKKRDLSHLLETPKGSEQDGSILDCVCRGFSLRAFSRTINCMGLLTRKEVIDVARLSGMKQPEQELSLLQIPAFSLEEEKHNIQTRR
jgi:hypothetical protein